MDNINSQTLCSRIPKIRQLRRLGSGGQKTVYSAVHVDYGKVAVKVVVGAQQDARVMREIELATACRLPNTAVLHDWGTINSAAGSALYIIEEFVEGNTLRQELQRKGRLPLDAALRLVAALLETAVAMEGEGIVHRDIKPENIMVCPDGGFRLLDFGIARQLAKTSITPTVARYGPHTLGYAAPEQIRNLKKQIDIRTDLFAVGVVAYECLSGRHPFLDGARDRLDVLWRTEQSAPPPLEIDGIQGHPLADFVAVLMDKYPSRRPPSAQKANEWFENLLSQIAAGARQGE